MTAFIAELKRRNVFRVAGVYGVVGWLLAQVAVTAEAALHLPMWFDMVIVITLLMGFPVAMVFAWAFELTPEGVKRTHKISPEESITDLTAKKLDIAILVGLLVVGGLIVISLINSSTESNEQLLAEQNTQALQRAREQSIAVLPFEDFSADKDQAYFANGISEELLNLLSRTKGLKVSSRTSAFAFKDTDLSIAAIGEALNVAHVVEGSIRKSGNTLRISAQLIDTKTDAHLWTRTYDRPLSVDNIFEIQDEIASAIVGELRGKLDTKKQIANANRPTSIEAYEMYLQAKELSIQRKPDTLQEAVEKYKAAIDSAPDFAFAHAGLGETYLLLASYAGVASDTAISMAQPHIEKALALEPNASETLAAASLFERRKSNLQLSIDFARRAVEANPNNASALLRLGVATNSLGRTSEALEVFKQAKELDPISNVLHANVVNLQIAQGQLDDAFVNAEQFLRYNADNAIAHSVMANVLLRQGKYSLAHPALKEAEARNPTSSTIQRSLSELYLSVGLLNEALAVSRNTNLKAITLACGGKYEEALAMLDDLRSRYDKISVLYCARELDAHIDIFTDVSNGLGWPESIDLDSSFADEFALMSFVYAKTNHPDSSLFSEVLSEFFVNKTPKDFSKLDQLRSGSMNSVLNGKPESAVKWLDRILDLSILDTLLDEPIFDGLRNLPEFRAHLARRNTVVMPIRDSIEKELAQPKENWIIHSTIN